MERNPAINGAVMVETQIHSKKMLDLAGKCWVAVALIGQLVFAVYIAIYYTGSALRGDMAAWNKIFPRGYVAGDALGNVAVAIHLALAVIIILGGVIQLVPLIRTRVPTLHRWNGRIYVVVAFVISTVGLFMGLYRGSTGGAIQHIGIVVNALLVMIFAAMTFQRALAKNFYAHQQWAMRLFLAVSGVWFFRVLFMLWIVINQGPVGFDPNTFEGPFLYFLSFACFLVPLCIYELYIKAKESNQSIKQYAMAVGLVVCTLAVAIGIASATAFMWLPRLQ